MLLLAAALSTFLAGAAAEELLSEYKGQILVVMTGWPNAHTGSDRERGNNYVYKVFIVTPSNDSLKYMRELHDDSAYKFLSKTPHALLPELVQAPPHKQGELRAFLQSHDIPHEVFIDDLREYMVKLTTSRKRKRPEEKKIFVEIPPAFKGRYADVNNYIRDVIDGVTPPQLSRPSRRHLSEQDFLSYP